MIRAQAVHKSFGSTPALDSVTAEIRTGSIYGLIGSNGAGKSTFLRILAGILRPDSGSVTIDDQPVFENPEIKSRCFMISDEPYFFSGCTPRDLKEYYKTIYPHFDEARFRSLMNNFGLDERRKIRTFSKGMKKQVSVICAASSGADYLFCDETFDGLDPVARQAVKSLFAGDVAEFCATPVIASHNLRELEDFCDCIGLLHRGGILFSRDLDDMKLNIQKIQLIPGDIPASEILRDLDVMDTQRSGRMLTVTVRGSRTETEARLRAANPLYFELLPLSLEEIFIAETEVNGYDARKLIL
ncbi:ABC transporter ATP-binding protein [Butyricicoccus sp.]|uniref:ABC transporter ATP-binding protein n=1 Tax=Butyricicoccus sp. TaxID=2049021 RepID=UPI0037359C1E